MSSSNNTNSANRPPQSIAQWVNPASRPLTNEPPRPHEASRASSSSFNSSCPGPMSRAERARLPSAKDPRSPTVDLFREATLRQFPSMPSHEIDAMMNWTLDKKHPERVGRADNISLSERVYKAVDAYVRHEHTAYEQNYRVFRRDRAEQHRRIQPEVDAIMNRWRKPKLAKMDDPMPVTGTPSPSLKDEQSIPLQERKPKGPKSPLIADITEQTRTTSPYDGCVDDQRSDSTSQAPKSISEEERPDLEIGAAIDTWFELQRGNKIEPGLQTVTELNNLAKRLIDWLRSQGFKMSERAEQRLSSDTIAVEEQSVFDAWARTGFHGCRKSGMPRHILMEYRRRLVNDLIRVILEESNGRIHDQNLHAICMGLLEVGL